MDKRVYFNKLNSMVTKSYQKLVYKSQRNIDNGWVNLEQLEVVIVFVYISSRQGRVGVHIENEFA